MFKDYDTKADLWSLGVVILQLLMNKPATEMPQLFQEVSRNQDYVKQLCEQKVSCINIVLLSHHRITIRHSLPLLQNV